MCKIYREQKRGGVGVRSQNQNPFYSDTHVNEVNKCQKKLLKLKIIAPASNPNSLRCQISLLHGFLLTTGNVNLIFCNYKYKSESYLVTIKLLTSSTIYNCLRDKLSVNISPPFQFDIL